MKEDNFKSNGKTVRVVEFESGDLSTIHAHITPNFKGEGFRYVVCIGEALGGKFKEYNATTEVIGDMSDLEELVHRINGRFLKEDGVTPMDINTILVHKPDGAVVIHPMGGVWDE